MILNYSRKIIEQLAYGPGLSPGDFQLLDEEIQRTKMKKRSGLIYYNVLQFHIKFHSNYTKKLGITVDNGANKRVNGTKSFSYPIFNHCDLRCRPASIIPINIEVLFAHKFQRS